MLPNNKEAFEKLIGIYESITDRDLTDACVKNAQRSHYASQDFLEELTGFGDARLCTLCVEARTLESNTFQPEVSICKFCVYKQVNGKKCYEGNHADTYINLKGIDIGTTQGRENFLYAIQERVKHMKRVLNKLFKKEKENDILC